MVSLVVVAVIGAVLLTTKDPSKPTPAPALPSKVLVPPKLDLAALRGKPAAINFWASWCGPCRDEAPALEVLSRSLHGSARLVGVDYTDNPDGAREFISKYGITYPVLVDPDGIVGDRYHLTGLPDTAIVDSRGNLVELLRGPQDAAAIRAALDAQQD